jgi:hypothetical protein
MKRVFASAAWFAVVGCLAAGSAFAQTPGTSSAPPATAPGSVQTGPAAYPQPPGTPPPGTHYEWIFSYDRHGNYLGHWEAVRDR